MPRKRSDWEARYAAGNLPWDTGRPDRHLQELVTETPITPCRALEIGCGTGTNAIWLARQGFDVTAIDISERAIAAAQDRVAEVGLALRFLAGDVINASLPGEAFAFAFDRGCFHSFDEPEERSAFAMCVAGTLQTDGHWFSLIGSTDGPPRDVGPPRRSAHDIADAVEPHFEILHLTACYFDSALESPPRAWACLMRKRP